MAISCLKMGKQLPYRCMFTFNKVFKKQSPPQKKMLPKHYQLTGFFEHFLNQTIYCLKLKGIKMTSICYIVNVMSIFLFDLYVPECVCLV